MVTKDVQANLRKYKMGAGQGGRRTPSRGRRSASRGPDGEEALSPAQGSPTVRFEGQGRRSVHGDDNLAASKAIRECLKELDNGIGEKMSLLKMLVIKCDEADQNYNRLRNYINYGELENADKYVTPIQINFTF